MSPGAAAGEVAADWTIRLFETIGRLRDDITLIRTFWRLLRAARDPSPIIRVKLATAQALLAALRAEEARSAPPPPSEG